MFKADLRVSHGVRVTCTNVETGDTSLHAHAHTITVRARTSFVASAVMPVEDILASALDEDRFWQVVEILGPELVHRLNAKDDCGYNTIFRVVRHGDDRLLMHLLQIDGIDAHTALRDDVTPLHIAAANDDVRCLRLLLAAPAVRPDAMAFYLGTPLSIAVNRGSRSCVAPLARRVSVEELLTIHNRDSPEEYKVVIRREIIRRSRVHSVRYDVIRMLVIASTHGFGTARLRDALVDTSVDASARTPVDESKPTSRTRPRKRLSKRA